MKKILLPFLLLFPSAVFAQGQGQPVSPVGTPSNNAYTVQGSPNGAAIPVAPGGGSSGVASVTGTIGSATQSSSFTPTPGRLFNITLSGTFVASCQLERQLSGSWYYVTVSAAGSVIQAEYWTVPASDSWVEGKNAVAYRINCGSAATGGGWVSGTINYRFDQ